MIALNPQAKRETNREAAKSPEPGTVRAEHTLTSPQNLLSALNWRYAVKHYDPTRTIDDATWEALEEALVLTSSSGGLQPWKFFVVDDPAVRTQLREASYGQPQITDADRLVVFAAKSDVTAHDVDRFVGRIAEVRKVSPESLAGLKGMLSGIVSRPREARKEWAGRQLYIALGTFLTAAAALGVDATPMEGLDAARYDEILGLAEKGYRTLAVAAVGYRSADDKYASLAKVRFARGEVVEHV